MASFAVRQIAPDEWRKLKPAYEDEGGVLPDPLKTTAAVAECKGEICGFWAVEGMVHVGPLWVSPHVRGNGLYKKLLAYIEERILTREKGTGYYVFSNSERTDHICKSSGMVMMSWKVWKREF